MAIDTFTAPTGTTQYVVFIDPITGGWWRTTIPGYETFNAANIADYDIEAFEFAGTGIFWYTIPATLPSGLHNVQARTRAGGAPAVGDLNGAGGMAQWNGTVLIPLSGLATAWGESFVEGDITNVQALRAIVAFIMGKTLGANTANPRFRDLADTKNRIDMTVDTDGNRSAVAKDLT